jgi:hypothetical protein
VKAAMASERIRAEKVTKPIQLLAAWLAGLIIIDSAFLTAATAIQRPHWAAGALVIAAMANVPLFLAALFLLQTKFRPEMQEDVYYAKHLERVYSSQTRQTELIELKRDARIVTRPKDRSGQMRIQRGAETISINDLLPRYKELAAALAARGIVAEDTFGSTSDPALPPRHFIIAIGSSVPLSLIKTVVEIASKFGLEGLAGLHDDDQFDMHEGRLYIGAYDSDAEGQFIPTTPDILKKMASPAFTQNDLDSLLRRTSAIVSHSC